MLKGNAIIGQSGGPTSVINASLCGVIQTSAKYPDQIEKILGMRYGIEGFMEELVIDLGRELPETVEALKTTPSSALGSCRHKMKDEDFPLVLELLKKFNIRYYFLIGGNDTMDTIHRVEAYCKTQGYDLIGVGVPHDWSTHGIGHELTAMYGLDHAQTLAAILPFNLRVRRKAKRAKLLQYAHRVWQIPTTTDEEKAIDMAIDKTAAFFETMGLKSSLAKLGIEREVIEKLPARLQEHGLTALGEHGEVTPVVVAQILKASMGV